MIRYKFLIILLISLLFAVIFRLVKLQIFEQAFLKKQGNAMVIRAVNVQPYRGMILDRNNEPLAVSTKVGSVWLNPKVFDLNHFNVPKLFKLLKINEKQFIHKLNQHMDKEFLYLKRHVTPYDMEIITNLNIPGINFISEYKRYYPTGEVSAHVLGTTNLDDQGTSGIEFLYNNQLQGVSGKKIVINDRLGREVEYIKNVKEMSPGKNIISSIDHRLQYLSHKELKEGIFKHGAKSGSVVILDVQTGEVLAMVNQPTFNPNEKIIDVNSEKYRNIAVTDYFEPASSIKAFSVASILERGISPNTLVDTSPGIWQLKGGIIKDLKNHGVLNIATILQHSSNIGISKLVLSNSNVNSADLLWDFYDRVGFGATTSSGFPGESPGVLNLPNKNQQFVLATMSFGYGIAVTPLQLSRAYAILGTKGIRRPVSFLKLTEPQLGYRVIGRKISEQILEMLALSSSRRTSNLTKVDGYNIAGKTGTARKLGKNSYDKNRHLAVFCGLAPANNPKFSIVVTINEPSISGYYGNQVAEPIFAKIAAGALRILNVPPDPEVVYIAQNGANHS